MSYRMNISGNNVTKLKKIIENENDDKLKMMQTTNDDTVINYDDDDDGVPLTPISSLARGLSFSSISSEDSPFQLSDTPRRLNTGGDDLNKSWNNQREGDKRLFRNVFKIKGTPESAVKKVSKSKRLIGMASGRSSSPELSSSSPCSNIQNVDCAATFTPEAQNSTPRKSCNVKSSKLRLPLEEFDPNSQDSGYGASFSEEKQNRLSGFQFIEPQRAAPRRLSLESRSPMKSPLRLSPMQKRPTRSSLFRSLSSGYESTDDGFNDLIDMEGLEEESFSLPNGLTSLITGDIVVPTKTHDNKPMELDATPESSKTKPCFKIRRSLSMYNERFQTLNYDNEFDEDKSSDTENSMNSSFKVRSCLFRSPNASSSVAKLGFDENPRRPLGRYDSPETAISRKFKRPEPPVDHSPTTIKRSRKCTSFYDTNNSEMMTPPHQLQRSLSETETHAHIKYAVSRSVTDSDLTGDFSKCCVLPLANGSAKHEDLKLISPDTLSTLMSGGFKDQVRNYKIVDCRYPYEYDAGHINGAINLYTKEQIQSVLLDPMLNNPQIDQSNEKRDILIFHCEFSWERGPSLSRYLRNIDRQRNKEHYPALHYPEIYLLHGGYQKFFELNKSLCSPQGYKPMRDPEHEADLKLFRSKSKSWQGEKPPRTNVLTARANLKRLGF